MTDTSLTFDGVWVTWSHTAFTRNTWPGSEIIAVPLPQKPTITLQSSEQFTPGGSSEDSPTSTPQWEYHT